jgi:hypothetical protein
VQPPLGGDREAGRLGDGNEVAQMPQIRETDPCLTGMAGTLQSLFSGREENLDPRAEARQTPPLRAPETDPKESI